MAFADFYFHPSSGLANNSGSTTGASIGNYTGGALSTVANVWTFTPAGGANPVTDGITVGSWVSIYVDGGGAAAIISQVTNVTATTVVGSSTTNKFGTVPTDGAANRSLKCGGPLRNLASFATLLTGTPGFAVRFNYIAGTYSNTTTAITIAVVGTTTAPVVHRGYKTTPGDLDTRPTVARGLGTDMPEFTWTTAGLTVNGAFNYFSNIAMYGARTAGAQIVISANSNRFHRCYLEDTGANAASNAVDCLAGTNPLFSECFIKATTTATRVIAVNRAVTILGCVVVGGIDGIGTTNTSAGLNLQKNVITGYTTYGINWANAGGNFYIDSNTIYGGVDCIRLSALPPSNPHSFVSNNLLVGYTGFGLKNTTGTDTDLLFRNGNAHYPGGGGAAESGLGDSPIFNGVTLAADPFVNAAGSDFSLTAVAIAALQGIPGLFENQSYTSYLKQGAVQPPIPSIATAKIIQNIGTY